MIKFCDSIKCKVVCEFRQMWNGLWNHFFVKFFLIPCWCMQGVSNFQWILQIANNNSVSELSSLFSGVAWQSIWTPKFKDFILKKTLLKNDIHTNWVQKNNFSVIWMGAGATNLLLKNVSIVMFWGVAVVYETGCEFLMRKIFYFEPS